MITISKLFGIKSKEVEERIKKVGCFVCKLEGTMACYEMDCSKYVRYGKVVRDGRGVLSLASKLESNLTTTPLQF